MPSGQECKADGLLSFQSWVGGRDSEMGAEPALGNLSLSYQLTRELGSKGMLEGGEMEMGIGN